MKGIEAMAIAPGHRFPIEFDTVFPEGALDDWTKRLAYRLRASAMRAPSRGAKPTQSAVVTDSRAVA
jgi:hypothetical protein